MIIDIKSNKVHKIVICIIGVILLLVAFELGVIVGFHKAGFSGHLGDNFYRAFGGGASSSRGMMMDDIPSGHGAAGKIVRVDLPTFVVAGPDNVEKVVILKQTGGSDDQTIFRHFRDNASTSDIVVGNYVLVFGSPNEQGQIEAKLVRILPPPPSFMTDRPASSTSSLNK